jgi:hypothetical protein
MQIFWHFGCLTREQKKLFGPSKRLLPYVECTVSSEMYQFQNDDCKKEGIGLIQLCFLNGSYIFGVANLEKLLKRTNCHCHLSIEKIRVFFERLRLYFVI